ncbi:MAG: DUF2094 domain-containing protein [Deferribacteres bacterium]|nr:DUF2094 domain-containing protein [Deferribacteres bacterium]
MLGTIKSGLQWNWTAYGKHPSAKDYFRLGPETPLSKSFSDWVDRGYRDVVSRDDSGREPVAWRFWARGAGRESLACGLVKDSSDSLGRPYPFLIIGSGCLKDWEDRWDLLPIACEKPWGSIEYISARAFDDFRALETAIRNIRPPFPDWTEFSRKREILISKSDCSAEPGSPQWRAGGSPGGEGGIIRLDRKTFHEQCALISVWHRLLRRSDNTAPNAIFMGGTFERSYMAFFKRPLLTGDFVRLWSISPGSGKRIAGNA